MQVCDWNEGYASRLSFSEICFVSSGFYWYHNYLRHFHKYWWYVDRTEFDWPGSSLADPTAPEVVILLNVLIAVIADSYEKATVSSAMLFGRARVTFVAQNEALEAFLQPGVNPMQALRGIMAPRTFLSRLFTLFRWFVPSYRTS